MMRIPELWTFPEEQRGANRPRTRCVQTEIAPTLHEAEHTHSAHPASAYGDHSEIERWKYRLAKACRKNYTLQNPDSCGSCVFRGFGGVFHPGGSCNFKREAVRTNTGGPQRSIQGGLALSARSGTWSREKLESRGRHSLGSARLRLAFRRNQNLAGFTAASVTAGLNA